MFREQRDKRDTKGRRREKKKEMKSKRDRQRDSYNFKRQNDQQKER